MKKLEAMLNTEAISREERDSLAASLEAFNAKDVVELAVVIGDWIENAATGDKRGLAQKLSYEIQQNI